MDLTTLAEVNYDFTRNVLAKAVVRNPELFYTKYITSGHDAFVSSLRSAWANCAKGNTYSSFDITEICIEISHVYQNGDFFLLATLPNALKGSDLIGFYINEQYDEQTEEYLIDINYYIFYKTDCLSKYILLKVDNKLNLMNLGYISAHENQLIQSIYNKNKSIKNRPI